MITASRSVIRRFLTHPPSTWISVASVQTQPQTSQTTSATPPEENVSGKREVTREDSKSPGMRIISTKIENRLPKREPLMKNMFMCRVDTDLLVYPEVFNYQDHPEMMEKVTPIQRAFDGFEDLSRIDPEGVIPDSVWRKIESLGLFGLNIPQHFNGLGYIVTDSLLALESLASEPALMAALGVHHQVAEAILKFGTEEQKQTYLPRLATGELVASVALNECKDAVTGFFNTNATINHDKTVWTISGEKSFVVNGRKANLLLVFADVESVSYKGAKDENTTIFLVETDRNGVEKSLEAQQTLGFRGAEGISVKFNNVEVPSRNILGEIASGIKVGEEVFKLMRLQSSLSSVGILKKLLKENAQFCVDRKQGDKSMTEMEMMKNRFSKILCDTFAIESMIYFTAGLIDIYDGQDVELECSILKNFSNMALNRTINVILGHRDFLALTPGHVTERFLRDALQFQTHGEIMDSVKCLMALTGLQFLGKEMYEHIKKVRNPLFNPGFIMKRLFTGQSFESPKKFANLEHYLHLSAKPGTDALELCIVRLHLMSEYLLNRHGTEIFRHHNDLFQLSEVASLCFAMFCSVARASRSYCIGLRYAENEMQLANVFCGHASERINQIALSIQESEMVSMNDTHQILGKQLFKTKGYFPEHPLTRNF